MKMDFSFTKDSISISYRTTPLRGLLCKLQFHKWQYFLMSKEFRECFPDDADDINRRCIHCGFMEVTRDGKAFRGRA